MSRWILILVGFFCFSGILTLPAQVPRAPKLDFTPYQSPTTQVQRALPAPTSQTTPEPANSPPATITAQSMDQLDDTRKVGVGDRLSFQVLQDRATSPTPLVVTDVGEVQFPLIGRVKAANKTLKQLAYEVKQLMDKEYYYNSTVLIGLDASSKFRGRIYVIGNVSGVGPQDIPSDEVFTVSKAILRAGGFGDFADQRKVKLIRKGAPGAEAPLDKDGKKEEIIIDCKAIFKGDTNAIDPVLQPDDMILVPAKLINF